MKLYTNICHLWTVQTVCLILPQSSENMTCDITTVYGHSMVTVSESNQVCVCVCAGAKAEVRIDVVNKLYLYVHALDSP